MSGKVEIYIVVCHFGDELGAAISRQVVFRKAVRITLARHAKRSPQIADLVQSSSGFMLILVNCIVLVLQIPIADERHHYPKTIELARAFERIVSPAPVADFLSFPVPLQAYLADITLLANEILPT